MGVISVTRAFDRDESYGHGIKVQQKCQYYTAADSLSLDFGDGHRVIVPVDEFRQMISLVNEALEFKGNKL